MATLITKNSSTASAAPLAADLTQGELAVNVTDKKLYSKDSGGAVVKLVGGLGNQEANAVAITGGAVNGTTVGATTASTGAFTTLSASSTVSGTGFSTYLASPPAIGGTAAAAISATTLSASSTLSVTGAGSIQGLTVGRGAGAVATNTAVGASALATNSVGTNSTAIGTEALYNMTTGPCTAVGYRAGYSVTTGDGNTFLGRFSGGNSAGSITGATNTGVGNRALQVLTSGANNVAVGSGSMPANTTGSANVAVGLEALTSNTTASNSTAVGYQAGYTSTGQRNAFFGSEAGYANTTGESNTYIGRQAGNLMTSGNNNTIIGRYNGNQDSLDIRTASNYVVISDGDGTRQITMKEGQTLALDSAVPNAGTGITFPATQSASSDANTLDDYEEGTWTPVITSSSGSLTAYTSSGTYTKIGRSVTVTFNAVITTPGTASDKMDISGFPFTNGNGYQTPTLCREMTNTGTAYQAFINASATTGHVRSLTEGAISWTTNSRYVFFITYVV